MLIQIMRRTLGVFALGWVGLMAMSTRGGELPARYLPLDYIQATGDQWINTAFKPLCTDRIELKMMLTSGTLDKTQALYCARGLGGTTLSISGFFIGNGAFRFCRNAKTVNPTTFTPVEETEYTVSVDYGASTASVNGGKIADLDDTTSFTVGSPMVLFASHNGGTDNIEKVNNMARYRLYWFRVYDSAGNLKREFLPVVDLEARDESPQRFGLYETQTDTYFSTRETTPFIPGLTTIDLSTRTGIISLRWAQAAMNNATITVKVAGRTLSLGDKLITWAGAKPEGATFAFDASADGVNPVVSETGLFYGCAENSAFVDVAEWTGDADDDDFANAANWACKNPLGESVPDGVPGVLSTVRFSGDIAFQVPDSMPFAYDAIDLRNARLTANCDWTGLDTSVLFGTIDLCGHKLTVSKLGGTASITDEAEGYDYLSYLSCNGSQWVDTEFLLDGTDRIEMGLNFHTMGSKPQTLWCTRKADSSDTFTAFMLDKNFRFDHNTAGQKIASTVELNKDYSIIADGNSRDVTINGTVYRQQLPAGTPNVENDLVIFSAYGGTMRSNYGYYKFYYLRVYAKDGTLKRDFVPARQRSSGVLGLADRVTGGFWSNGGEGDDFEAGSISQEGSDARGELHVVVPEGETLRNGTVRFEGAMKLVKEGTGTFIAAKASQTYTGGTVVKGGTLTAPGSANDAYYGTKGIGVVIQIDEGGVLDNRGNYDYSQYKLVLNGGELANSGGDMTNDATPGFGYLDLRTNAVVRLASDTVFKPALATTINSLNGHVLAVELAGTTRVKLSGTFANGTVELGTGGYAQLGNPNDFSTCDLVLKGTALNLGYNLTVRNYYAETSENPNLGTAEMRVTGRFTPAGDSWYGCILQSYATLDLTRKTVTLPISYAKTPGDSTVTFAEGEGATIIVDLKGRAIRNGGRAVAWDVQPTTTFLPTDEMRRAGYRLVSEPDGLHVYRGLVILVR